MDVVLIVCFILSLKHLVMTTVAPNAQITAKRLRHELEMAKQKVAAGDAQGSDQGERLSKGTTGYE